MGNDSDSDAPEELTAEQGIKQDEEIRRIQKESKIRVAQEGKERRRQWAKRRTREKPTDDEILDVPEEEEEEVAQNIPGMLPSNIVNLLAAREKQVFSSDSEEETTLHKPTTRKKKLKPSGRETVLLKDIPPPQCLQNSMEFLKRRKAQVARSPAVLKNAKQAFRLLSANGSLLSKS